MKTKEEILTSHISFDGCHENFINKIYIAMQEYSDLTNAKLVESLEYLRSCYDLELLNKTKLVEENERLLQQKDKLSIDFQIAFNRCAELGEQLGLKESAYSELGNKYSHLLVELSKANERIKELEDGIKINTKTAIIKSKGDDVVCIIDSKEYCVRDNDKKEFRKIAYKSFFETQIGFRECKTFEELLPNGISINSDSVRIVKGYNGCECCKLLASEKDHTYYVILV